jgi:hypothetical protein
MERSRELLYQGLTARQTGELITHFQFLNILGADLYCDVMYFGRGVMMFRRNCRFSPHDRNVT